MMVSFIQSNYAGFGSGVVVPGTGVSMQNRGFGFTTEAGHQNIVAGGKRPFHTIIPGFAMKDGQPLMAYGMMGGPIQAQGHMQLLLRSQSPLKPIFRVLSQQLKKWCFAEFSLILPRQTS